MDSLLTRLEITERTAVTTEQIAVVHLSVEQRLTSVVMAAVTLRHRRNVLLGR